MERTIMNLPGVMPGDRHKLNNISPQDEFINVLLTLCRDSQIRRAATGTNIVNIGATDVQIINNINKYVAYDCKGDFYRLIKLYDSYNAALMSSGLYPSYDDVLKCDFIDASTIIDIGTYPDNYRPTVDEINEYVGQYGIYAQLPCFNHGRLKLCNGCEAMWTVRNLDLDKKKFDIDIAMYGIFAKCHLTSVVPFGEFTMHIDHNEPTEMQVRAEYKKSLIDLYMSVPIRGKSKVLPWTKEDRRDWDRTFMRFLRDIEGGVEFVSYNTMVLAGKYVLTAITSINLILNRNKSKSSRRSTGKTTHIAAYDEAVQKQRKIRKIGGVTFQSAEFPMEPARDTTIIYRTAAWNVRGHYRHYRSGKVIYIPPKVHHRQCMGDLAKTVTPRAQSIQVTTE